MNKRAIHEFTRNVTKKGSCDLLLLTFPELKQEQGTVNEVLRSMKANDEVMKTWSELVGQEMIEPDGDGEF
ncbi:MAG: hypothetical protein ACRD9S_14390 [Pyrinomonadaceae bacterium]